MKSNLHRWKGFALGMLGGVAGLLAMRSYWQKVAPALEEQASQQDTRNEGEQATQPLEDISIFGKQYREEESSTAALGRIIYQSITGQEPETQETKTMLSYLVHWAYGILQGGVYGALQSGAGWPDLKGGLLFGTALWLYGDEAIVPLLGLQSGPTAVSPIQHANRLGAHLAYGAATALATQTLRRII